ncbi:type II secretion system protein GspG [Thermodesulfobacteriota bacterium]
MRFNKSAGGSAFETVIILSLVGIFLVFAISRFMQNVKYAKEIILQGELVNIRTSIKLYKMLNSKYPESLEEMTQNDYIMPYSEDSIIEGTYLIPNAVDENGIPLDPFGNKYGYNRENGEIKCLTKGYKGW